jgi:hypothetical protein
MSDAVVRVLFVDADSEEPIGRVELPVKQLPGSFDTETTLELGDATWSVVRAEPPAAAQFARTGSLTLTLRRVESVPARDILYSLPTLCDALPPITDTAAARIEIHEDDWRQLELVSVGVAEVVNAELRAVRAVYDNHAVRDADGRVVGFKAIHVRTQPTAPLGAAVQVSEVLTSLPRAMVGFRGQPGAVAGSFAGQAGRVLVYGLAVGDQASVLALRPDASPARGGEPALAIALAQLMRQCDLVLVDWCRAAVIGPDEVGDYLTG